FSYSRLPRSPTSTLFPYTTLFRSQWLALETLKARQAERLRQILRYAAAHCAYYERIFRTHRFDPEHLRLPAFQELPLLTKANIRDRKSTRLNSSHLGISYAVFCLK